MKLGRDTQGLPFYLLEDNKSLYNTRGFVSKDIQILKDRILKHVREDYAHKIKRKPAKYKKVWHLNQ